MSMHDLTNGTTAEAGDVDDNINTALSLGAINLVRQLTDRSVAFSGDMNDFYGESYIDADGRNNSVDTDELVTTAVFVSGKYKTPDYNYTGNEEEWSDGILGGSGTITMTGTVVADGVFDRIKWSSTDNSVLTIKKGAITIYTTTISSGSATNDKTIDLNDYSDLLKNGDTWTIEITNCYRTTSSTIAYSGSYFSFSAQYAIAVSGSSGIINYKTAEESSFGLITHDIPTGTFPATCSSFIGKSLVKDWETGASIQHKIQSDALSGNFLVIEANGYIGSSYNSTYDVSVRSSGGKYYVYANSGTDEEQRAKIYAALIYSNQITQFTGLTAVKSKWTKDVDKRMYYLRTETTGSNTAYDRISFANTTTNTDCSAWGYVYWQGYYYTVKSEFNSGTDIVYSSNPSGAYTYGSLSNLGEDTSALEQDNPSYFQAYCSSSSGSTNYLRSRTIVLAKGAITESESGTATIHYIKDYYTDYSVPEITLATETGLDAEDSDWINDGVVGEFTAFTSEPTKMITKLIPKTTSPTSGYPSINGVGYRGA